MFIHFVFCIFLFGGRGTIFYYKLFIYLFMLYCFFVGVIFFIRSYKTVLGGGVNILFIRFVFLIYVWGIQSFLYEILKEYCWGVAIFCYTKFKKTVFWGSPKCVALNNIYSIEISLKRLYPRNPQNPLPPIKQLNN